MQGPIADLTSSYTIYPWTYYGLAIEVMSKFEMPAIYSFLPKSLPKKKRTAQFLHIAKFPKKRAKPFSFLFC